MDRLIGFDPQLLHDAVLTGINIFILFFCLSYLLFNPVRDVLEKRKKKIADELASAAGDMASASALKESDQTGGVPYHRACQPGDRAGEEESHG